MKKVLIVFGTRPEAIKMAPLVLELRKCRRQFDTIVCVTAQHRGMLDQVLNIFDIEPDYDLNIMQPNQDLYDISSRVLLGMKGVLTEINPDIVLVHGDTTTSTMAAISAFYKQIPVGHIEAGLRTHNIYSPWPEEMNRQITGRITKLHFAPTAESKRNLISEGINPDNVCITGNTVIDALYWVNNKIMNSPEIQNSIRGTLKSMSVDENKCDAWQCKKRKLVLITGHRRENFGQGFRNICEALKEVRERFSDVDFIYPMHLNPHVRKPIYEIFGFDSEKTRDFNNIYFLEPLDYLSFIYLMNLSYLVLTDSGGIQEEAPSLGKPVLVMRNNSERPEAIESGTVRLVGTDKDRIIKEVSDLINNHEFYSRMSHATNPYGDGKACERIVDKIKQEFESVL